MGIEARKGKAAKPKEIARPPEGVYERAHRLAAFSKPWSETFLDLMWKMEEIDMSLASSLDRASGDLTKSLYETTGGDPSGVTAEVILDEFKKVRPGFAHMIDKFKPELIKESSGEG